MTTDQRRLLSSLVSRCARRGWAVAYNLLRDADEANDAVQQGFIVAARKPDRIPIDDPWPWFGVVVAHEARNLRRKKKPVTNREIGHVPSGGSSVHGADNPENAVGDVELRDRVRTAIERLPAAERDAVAMIYMAGMTHAAAAEALDVPRQTVTLRAKRGLGRLAYDLKEPRGGWPRFVAGITAAAPNQGWPIQEAAWFQTASSSVPAIGTTASVASTIALGGLSMAMKPVWIASIVAAFGAGLMGGHAWRSSQIDVSHEGSAQGSSRDPMLRGPADRETHGAPQLETSDPKSSTEDEASRRLRAAQQNELVAELQRENRELKDQLATARRSLGPTSGPIFTFSQAGKLKGVLEADWGFLARASGVVSDAILERANLRAAGKPVPRELSIRLQEYSERMRTYEYRTIDKIKTDARHNGEFTHPVTIANLLGAILDDARDPLTSDQVKAITKLGTQFQTSIDAMREQWAKAPRVKRVVEEYRLKGGFCDDLKGVLTSSQRAIVYREETEDIAGLDMHSPTLMILHTSPVLTGSEASEIRQKLRAVLKRKYALEEEACEPLDRALEAWSLAVAPLMDDFVASARLRNYTYAEGLQAGEATVALLNAMLNNMELSEQARKSILNGYAIYVPRKTEAMSETK